MRFELVGRLGDVYSGRIKNVFRRTGLDPVLRRAFAKYHNASTADLMTFESDGATMRFAVEGLGDRMIVRQAGPAFERVAEDVSLGETTVVVAGGIAPNAFNPPDGDVNIFWWWSMDRQDDFLEYYLQNASVTPDLVLCPSQRTQERAEDLGLETLYLPLACGEQFRPLDREREGVGFAGGDYTGEAEQRETVLGPFLDRENFEWVRDKTTPEELNAWYNSKRVTLGMTKTKQERWGMVNNRVFEALGSGTPFIIHEHRELEDVLGFEYPWQTGSRDETRRLYERLTADFERWESEFEDIAERIRSEHTYDQRMRTLLQRVATL